MKRLIYALLALLYILVTYFGLGPVLLADGTDQERMLTLMVVIAVYAAITILLWIVAKKRK